MKRSKIPPLGARPRFVVLQERIIELQGAFTRFIESNRPIPVEFVTKYNELVNQLEVEE